MNTHWSESDSIELLRISINNYPKFVHLKNNNEPDKFFDDRCFAKFHNFGRNGKSIKNRIETIQKKFRKYIRVIDIERFKEGNIEGDIYKNDEAKDLFNTSFEFERLYGKHCSSKELMKLIEMVGHSEYWTNNRRRIHPRWNKRTYDSQESLDENVTPKKAHHSNQIVISSTETSPSQSDDLAPFRDADYIDSSIMPRRNCQSNLSTRLNNVNVAKNGAIMSKYRSKSSKFYNDNRPPEKTKGISVTSQTSDLMSALKVSSVTTEDKGTNTNMSQMHLTVSGLNYIDIQPNEIDDRSLLSKSITSTFGPMGSDMLSIKETLSDISHSIHQLVQLMTPRTD